MAIRWLANINAGIPTTRMVAAIQPSILSLRVMIFLRKCLDFSAPNAFRSVAIDIVVVAPQVASKILTRAAESAVGEGDERSL